MKEFGLRHNSLEMRRRLPPEPKVFLRLQWRLAINRLLARKGSW